MKHILLLFNLLLVCGCLNESTPERNALESLYEHNVAGLMIDMDEALELCGNAAISPEELLEESYGFLNRYNDLVPPQRYRKTHSALGDMVQAQLVLTQYMIRLLETPEGTERHKQVFSDGILAAKRVSNLSEIVYQEFESSKDG